MNKEITLHDYPQLKAAHAFVQAFPGAVIAGGCPADILQGRDFKDVDIFIVCWSDASAASDATIQIMQALSEVGLSAVTDDHSVIYPGTINRFIVASDSDHPLDIVLIEKDDKNFCRRVVDYFDFVMCEAWMHPTIDGFVVQSTDLFDQHLKHKILAYYPEDSVRGSEGRVAKMQEKYPDFIPVASIRPAAPEFDFDGAPF